MVRAARGNWISALLGLSVLGVVSFLVGAFAGVVWKEPGLVAAYVRGDTTEITWSTASEEVLAAEASGAAEAAPPAPADAPRPAAVAAAPKPVRSEAAAPAASPAPPKPAPPKPPAVASAPPPGRIAVQVGAFAARDVAESLRVRLEQAGFPAYLAPGAQVGDHWRVRVGPFASRDEAAGVARRLEQGQKLPTWVLDEDAE